jgi:hypothetical protein
MTLPAASVETGMFGRFTLVESTATRYYVQIVAYIYAEPWMLHGAVWPAGVEKDCTRRVGSGTATKWFDLGKYAGAKLHERMQPRGGCR